MMNFSSVSIRGAFNFARARVLWDNGLLKVFDVDGPLLEIVAEKPQKRVGYLSSWNVNTAKGLITIRNKCITCGGRKWWRVVLMPETELWSAEW